METECDRVRNSRSNFPDDAFARVSAVSDDDNFHRAPDIPQIEHGLGQIHFLPRGNNHGRVKELPTRLVNSPVPIADFCNDTAGAGKTVFQRIAIVRANQQGLLEPTRQTTDRRNDTHCFAG